MTNIINPSTGAIAPGGIGYWKPFLINVEKNNCITYVSPTKLFTTRVPIASLFTVQVNHLARVCWPKDWQPQDLPILRNF